MAREDHEDLEHTGYRSGQVRIVGAQPAGRVTGGAEPPPTEEAAPDQGSAQGFVVPPLPHWTEPPTGEVPSVLSGSSADDRSDPFATLRAPTWREEDADWEAQDGGFEPSMLAGQGEAGGLGAAGSDRQPWVFDLPGGARGTAGDLLSEDAWDDEAEEAWDDLAGGAATPWTDDDGPATAVLPAVGREDPVPPGPQEPAEAPAAGEDQEGSRSESLVVDDLDSPPEPPASRLRSLRAAAGRRSAPRPPADRAARAAERLQPPAPPEPAEPPPRNVAAAIASGVVLGGLALITFKAGPAAAVGFITLVVTLAAAEAFAAFRRGGYHPATLLGLAATVSVMVAAYNRGLGALPLVLVLLVAACLVWHLVGVERTDAVRSTGTTVFVFAWVAGFGSFGALLLSPSLFPHRHGIAFLLGGVVAGVAYDVGALAFGAWLGRHPLASASPNKTWEGLVGGLVTSLIVSVVVLHLVHPWTAGKAAALALVVSVVATLGDLFESTVKRHLGLKDMGRLLPGHGGMLDRVDGLLFALPATYYLVLAFHLG